jgi:hydroxypyruvate reductase
MDIHAMNAWRKQFSQIKGGGLLQYVQHLQCTQLALSDVYGNDPAVIGSGLLVLSEYDKPENDSWLRSLLPGPMKKTESYNPVETHVIGSVEVAMQAVVEEALHQGLDHSLHDEFVAGDAVNQGKVIGQYLLDAAVGVHVWGGETTVVLPAKPGLGGRNQSMALSLATAIDGIDDISVLVAGTDGIDGNTRCAGAIVSGRSMQQARQIGFDVEAELRNANAGMVLMAIGDLFKPGPTNTNVMDVIIAYKRC